MIWQHLFWIFGHPEVYIVILPAFGILSEVVATFSRKRLFAYSSMVFATILIAFLGFMVWVHHMFTGGMGPLVNSIFAITSMMIAVPTGIKIFNWLFTMWGGQIRFTTAMLYAVGFIPTFVMGGVTGVMLAVAPADLQYHDTYFVVAHFHYVLIGGTLFGILAATYYWYPKIFGQMLDERLGKWSFWFVFIGFHMTFLIQHFLGLMGMPRRVFTYQEGFGFTLFNQISTIGTILLTIGVIIMLYNIVITAVRSKGKTVPADPWDGRTLEWAVSSPAPAYNFAQTPLVRGLDALWVEKEAGNKKMSPAEPLGPIHMPSNTFSAFLLSVAFFITGMGLIYRSLPITVVGVASIASCIVWFLLWEDKGYHIHPDEEPAEEGGA